MAAAAGAISALVTDTTFGYFKTGEAEYDLTYAMNGCLSGLVAVTAGTSVFTPWAAFVVGLVGGVVYCGFSALLLKLKIDDAVDATPVHFANGAWGCLAVGLLADPDRTSITYGSDLHGLFYSGNGNLLLVEFCGVLWIIGWVSITMIPFFLVLNFLGLFRVDALEEEVGLDISHHKGAAYDLAGPSKEDVEELVARRSTAHGKVAAPDA